MTEQRIRVKADWLRETLSHTLEALSVPHEHANSVADVLVDADLQGIESHGVGNFWRYVEGLHEGWINPRPTYRILADAPAAVLMDADAGLGHPAGIWGMERAIEKAKNSGVGVAGVSNSNHFGTAGYYARLALPHDMIGISLTNSQALVAPTFGREALLGTNPVAVAAPAADGNAFVLDMATSVAAQGRIAVKGRLKESIPEGWAINEYGDVTADTERVLAGLPKGLAALLPLGGAGETLGGHKGFGLALAVDILCGILTGAGYADTTCPTAVGGKRLAGNLGHLFIAVNVATFRTIGDFKSDLDDLIRRVKSSKKTPGEKRIFIHGEKEREAKERRLKEGIPLHRSVIRDLEEITSSLGLPLLGPRLGGMARRDR